MTGLVRALAVSVVSLVLLAGCGGSGGTGTSQATAPGLADAASTRGAVAEGKAPAKCPSLPDRSFSVALDDWETPEVVGIVMAVKRGYFADARLEVSALAPPGPDAVIYDVVGGYDAIGISHEPEAVLAGEAGEPIVIIGNLVQRPTAAMIWLQRSRISSIADLKGKTVGIPGLPFQERLLERVLAQAGLKRGDVKVESLANDMVPHLVSGRVDAILGRANLQGAELEARGLRPVIAPIQTFGTPSYDEAVLIAQADCVSRRPGVFRAFLAAVGRGTAAAIRNPEGAVRALKAEYESNPETSRKAMAAQVEATFPLLSKSGRMSRSQARRLVDWMHEEGMIERRLPVSAFLTNAYLRSSGQAGG